MNPIIQLQHVDAGYNGRRILHDISLTVYERDFLGIIGPNGGGKTTLVRIMLGLLQPMSGTVTYLSDGQPTRSLTMGYLPQYNDIDRDFPITVYEVVLSGLNSQKSLLRPFSKAQHRQVEDVLQHMGIDSLSQRPIGTLSGGQLQRVLLARAVVSQPDVVFLDEPNTYIDRQFQEQMYEMLEQINRSCAIVMVSHDIGSILQNVRDVACVNHTLHYHPANEVDEHILGEHFGCPVELLGHGSMPHRVLRNHDDDALPPHSHEHRC